MAYDPDKSNRLDILQAQQAFVSKDRQVPYDRIAEAISKSGLGITRVGDRLTVRGNQGGDSYWEAQFVLLEVILQRDVYVPDRK